MEHHLRYDAPTTSGKDKDKDKPATATNKNRSGAYKMQLRAMGMEREALEKEVISSMSIEDLSRCKMNTERHILQLASFNAWKKVKFQHLNNDLKLEAL